MALGSRHSYQYYSDGKPKFAQDQNSELIKDRAFSYDHVGRLAEAYSGTQARDFINNTNSGIADGPFRQSYNYDAWDNMLGDSWRFWSRSGATTASYNSSNRNPTWTYDADGNLLSRESDGAQYGYDAAGNNVTKTSASTFYSPEEGGYITNIFNDSQSYDGDEQLTHYIKTRSVSLNGGPLGVATQEHVYALRSTVLGGRVISEYNEQGAWKRSYVYAGSERIGEQTKAENGLAFNFWRHVDQITGDEMKTNSSGGSIGQTILDPQGVDVGREDPFPADGSGDGDGIPNLGDPVKNGAPGLLAIGGGGAKCVLDGISMDCSFIKGEVSVKCPNNDCSPQTIIDSTGKAHLAPLGFDPNTGRLGNYYWDDGFRRNQPADDSGVIKINNRGKYVWKYAGANPMSSYALHDVWLQTPEQMRRRQMTPEEISNFRDQLKTIDQGTCKEFLEGIRNSIPGAQNLMDVFNYMAANGGLHRQDYLRSERGYQIGGYGGGNVVDGTAGVTINFTFGDALFTLIHETTHASGGAGSRYVSHRTMAEAALSAAASAKINLSRYNRGPSDLKLEVWARDVPNADTHNSSVFQFILHVACDPYAKK